MDMSLRKFALAVSGTLLLACTLSAQEVSRVSFNFGAGFTNPVGATGRDLDVGWNIQGGGGYNFNSTFGLMLDTSFDQMPVNSGTLNSLGLTSGNINLWSLTLDPIVHVNNRGPVDVYFTGGGGLFHQYQDLNGVFTTPHGFEFPEYSTYTVNKPGIDAGMGVAFGDRWHGKFYAEARYERVFLGQYHTDAVPVSFGFRWQ